jgi:hypothetical protein
MPALYSTLFTRAPFSLEGTELLGFLMRPLQLSLGVSIAVATPKG